MASTPTARSWAANSSSKTRRTPACSVTPSTSTLRTGGPANSGLFHWFTRLVEAHAPSTATAATTRRPHSDDLIPLLPKNTTRSAAGMRRGDEPRSRLHPGLGERQERGAALLL